MEKYCNKSIGFLKKIFSLVRTILQSRSVWNKFQKSFILEFFRIIAHCVPSNNKNIEMSDWGLNSLFFSWQLILIIFCAEILTTKLYYLRSSFFFHGWNEWKNMYLIINISYIQDYKTRDLPWVFQHRVQINTFWTVTIKVDCRFFLHKSTFQCKKYLKTLSQKLQFPKK